MSTPMHCYRHPDRETYVSCSDCGRPICTECMTPAPVGQRCPEHSGKAQGMGRVTAGARRTAFEGTGALVTKALIAINIVVYVITAAQGRGINDPGGSLFVKWALYGPYVANGDWWRLITSTFLHANIIHIAFNMYFLWFVGSAVESVPRPRPVPRGLPRLGAGGLGGRTRGQPDDLDRRRVGRDLRDPRRSARPRAPEDLRARRPGADVDRDQPRLQLRLRGISWGGHIGGLIGGVLCTLVLSKFGRGHAAYSRMGLWGIAGVLAVGLLSIAVAYLSVRGYA